MFGRYRTKCPKPASWPAFTTGSRFASHRTWVARSLGTSFRTPCDRSTSPVHADAHRGTVRRRRLMEGEMDDGFEVRRNRDGSVDIAFYVARARRLRAQAIVGLFRSIRCNALIAGRKL